MDLVIEILREINIGQLIAIGILIWFFYNRLDNKIEKFRTELKSDNANLRQELKSDNASLRQELKSDNASLRQEHKSEIEKLSAAVEKLSARVEDIDKRLCRIEGSLSSHGHCLFNQPAQEKKAQ